MTRKSLAIVPGALFALLILVAGSSTKAADGQILITHSKALAGNVTPGDAANYPVTLSRSGSYILGSDLTPGSNRDAIVAASADIAIDLNGFKFSGGPAGGTNNARYGILANGDRLTVRNGTITGFESSAIQAPNRHYLIVEQMRMINNLYGINNPAGSFARIQNNTIATNLRSGITCGTNCHVESNVVSGNGYWGIRIDAGTVLDNTITSNGRSGIYVVSGTIGYGNNTLIGNNAGGVQIDGGSAYWFQLHPNLCVESALSCY